MEAAFSDWYDTYERDGGELLLFNAIDLRAAFLAGAEVQKAKDMAIAMHMNLVIDGGVDDGTVLMFGATIANEIERQS